MTIWDQGQQNEPGRIRPGSFDYQRSIKVSEWALAFLQRASRGLAPQQGVR